MAICGFLKTMPVAELFQWIGQCRKTGTLRISLPDGEHTIAFDNGVLIFCASTNPEKTLGRILIGQGRLTIEGHEMALRVRDESPIGIGKILTDLHMVRVDDLRLAINRKAEELIIELLPAEEGAFRFNPEVPRLDLVPVEVDLTRAILAATHKLDRVGADEMVQAAHRG
jgi:hypothetical protein